MNQNVSKIIKNALFIVITIALILPGFKSLYANNLNAYLSYTTFYSPDNGPYIETYLTVEGKSAKYVLNENGKFQATIQVILLFKLGDEVVNHDKYELSSPEINDTTNIIDNFFHQERYSLPNGSYEFEIQIWDINSEAKPYINLQPLVINYPKDEIVISGIQLVSSFKKTEEEGIFSKHGYDISPYVFNFFPEQVNKVTFFAEIYNTNIELGQEEKYLLKYYIVPIDKENPLSKYVQQKKETVAPVNILFSEFDISNLPSGNYFLTIEARSKSNELLGLNRIFIQRSNPRIQISVMDLANIDIGNTFVSRITDIDTLREYIQYLTPISSEQEKGFANAHLGSSDLETLQKYFYNFWLNQDKLDPEKAWNTYLAEVNKVNFAYSTQIQKGYDTDRGRIYLKYGAPNAISESYNEPAAYPYEIWHYYVLKNGQRNKKFIFYTLDIVTNDFTLLHSDVTGELSNYRWQYVLYSRVRPGFDIDQGATEDGIWGGNSKRYFDVPR
jgi:GWxTD domain-containing protein